DVERRGVRVVRGLRAVDVVVGVAELVLALRVAHQLEGPVRDHLVGVHVGRGARAALEDVQPELVVQLALDDLLAGLLDPGEHVLAELAALLVRARGGQLDHRERLDQVRVEAKLDPGDVEVLEGARGLDAVVGARGHRLLAEEVVLDTGGGWGHVRSPVATWAAAFRARRPWRPRPSPSRAPPYGRA